MVVDHVGHLAVAGQRELERDPETMRRCVSGSDAPHPGRRRAHAPELMVVLAGLQRDVVAEPLRLLMSIGMTPDVDQQRRVVDIGSSLLVEPDPLSEPQRDQALAQHVLHRLPKTEINAERQRGDELRQPEVRAIGLISHGSRLSSPRVSDRSKRRKMRGTPHDEALQRP